MRIWGAREWKLENEEMRIKMLEYEEPVSKKSQVLGT